MSREREAKLTASTQFRLPDLDEFMGGVSAAALAERHLDAVYYDTEGLDLARWGITLRHRTGEDGPPWTLKLPETQDGPTLVRRELSFDGPPGSVPEAAYDLLCAHARSRPLIPVARLHTDRTPVELRDATGERLAEIDDDHVTVYQSQRQTGEFREIEVELLVSGQDHDRLLTATVDRLVTAGCHAGPPVPKLVRALGPPALEPPELVVPSVDDKTTLEQLVRHSLARSVTQMLHHDPGVRLGDDPEDVHQFRVGTRRLRSDLRTLASLLEPELVSQLRDELRWLGAAVGAVRDTDVLAERLRAQVETLPEPDVTGAQALLAALASQADTARVAMLAALRSQRYLMLVDALVNAANDPPFLPTKQVDRPAALTAASFVRRPWRQLTDAVAALSDNPSDPELHNVRILAKRCRYAAEAVASVAGRHAGRFAAAITDVQTVLGDHQDTVIAEAWLRDAATTTPQGAVAAGELILIQRHQRTKLRAQWPRTWKKASAKELSSWI